MNPETAPEYTIGELADRFGLAAHVLRHWEDEGLLSPARRVAARRVYGPAHVAMVLARLDGVELAEAMDHD